MNFKNAYWRCTLIMAVKLRGILYIHPCFIRQVRGLCRTAVAPSIPKTVWGKDDKYYLVIKNVARIVTEKTPNAKNVSGIKSQHTKIQERYAKLCSAWRVQNNNLGAMAHWFSVHGLCHPMPVFSQIYKQPSDKIKELTVGMDHNGKKGSAVKNGKLEFYLFSKAAPKYFTQSARIKIACMIMLRWKLWTIYKTLW